MNDTQQIRVRLAELLADTCSHLIEMLSAVPASRDGLDALEALSDGFAEPEFLHGGLNRETRNAARGLYREIMSNGLVQAGWLNDRVGTAVLLYLLVDAADPESDAEVVLWRLAYALRREGALRPERRFAWLYSSRDVEPGELRNWADRCERVDATLDT